MDSNKQIEEMKEVITKLVDEVNKWSIYVPSAEADAVINNTIKSLSSLSHEAQTKAHVLEATHRANDAIERLWRLDNEACTKWYISQAEFYELFQSKLNKGKEL